MSGDIGTGTTRAAIKLGQKVLAAGLPGYVQLAGGTNGHTVSKLRSLGLLRPNPSQEPDQKNSNQQAPLFPADHAYISGVAYGSYARTLLLPILEQLETLDDHLSAQPSLTASLPALTKNWVAGASPQTTPSMSPANPILPAQLENFPDLLEQAVNHAHSLVSQLKPPSCKQYPPSIMFMSEQQIRPTLPPNVH
jgi:hypothetical protein